MEGEGNKELNSRLEEIETSLNEIKTALLGNKFNKDGYISKIDGLDKRVERLEKAQQAQLWFFLGSGMVGGAGLVKVLEHFFK